MARFTMEAIIRRRQLLFSIMSISQLATRASAYASQSSAHPCDTLSQTKLHLPSRKEHFPDLSSTVTLSRTRYDLGLGRNPPVICARAESSQPTPIQDVYEAARFWVEHQALMEYPSPRRSQELRSEPEQRSRTSADKNGESPSAATAEAKSIPFVQPKRLSPDLIDIHASRLGWGQSNDYGGRGSGRHPIATIKPHARKSAELELNTAWVEMLIHEQLQAMEGVFPQAA